VTSVGLRHIERRSFIRAEVKNLKHILLAVPGLLGPKFPVVLTAASMAKTEILHYFRHLGLDCRKDGKKHLNSDHYKDQEICLLIDDLMELTALVEKHREIIQMYYAEYLSWNDADYLSTLCQQMIITLPENSLPITTLLQSFPHDLRAVDIEYTIHANLNGFRMNWDRYTTLNASSKRYSSEINSELLKFIPEIIERSEYVDNLPRLLKRYFIPYELWWYQGRLMDTFRESLELNMKPLCCLSLMTTVPMNLHPDCPEEGVLLNDSVDRFTSVLTTLLTKFLESIVKKLWDYFLSLEKKTRAADAGHRLEKLALKQQDTSAAGVASAAAAAAAIDRVPGYESEGYNRKYLLPLIEHRRSLIALLEQAHSIGPIILATKEINLEILLRQVLSSYFESRIKSTILSKGDLERPSVMLTEIVIGCRVLQTLFDFLVADLSKLLRIVLFRNFCTTNLLPPGNNRHSSVKDQSDNSLIWKIAQWFQSLVLQAAASESGLMWIPSTHSFARAKSTLRAIDVYINREEMAALCGFVGIQGIRVIDNVLISLVMDKVMMKMTTILNPSY
jgi:hypothetical protein